MCKGCVKGKVVGFCFVFFYPGPTALFFSQFVYFYAVFEGFSLRGKHNRGLCFMFQTVHGFFKEHSDLRSFLRLFNVFGTVMDFKYGFELAKVGSKRIP